MYTSLLIWAWGFPKFVGNHLPESSGLWPASDMAYTFWYQLFLRKPVSVKGPPAHPTDTLWKVCELLQHKKAGPVWITRLQFLAGVLVTLTTQTIWSLALALCYLLAVPGGIRVHNSPMSALLSMDSIIPHLSSRPLAIHQPFQLGNRLPRWMFFSGDYHYKLMF